MKICVTGMGIIGGSICAALKRANFSVYGANRSQKPLIYALNNGIIDGVLTDFSDCDTVFVALPPKATVDFMLNTRFKDGAVVADICGVKSPIEAAICRNKRNFRYVGCHPMAGKEVSGIENACAELFDGASMVITKNAYTDGEALDVIRSLTKSMGFGKIVECSAEVHDRKISYTSQLAHIVSNAYVKDNEIDNCLGFTGGSFQDMTRIAGVDEELWSSLYLENADNVSRKIAALVSSLEEIKAAIDARNADALKKVLKNGRTVFEDSKREKTDGEITVTHLK